MNEAESQTMTPVQILMGLDWTNEPIMVFPAQVADNKLARPVVAWSAAPSKELISIWRDNAALFQSLRVFCLKMREGGYRILSIDPPKGLQKVSDDIAGSRSGTSDVEVPCPDGVAYLPFQKAGIAYARSREHVLFGDEMGLGKTIQIIGVINDDPSINTILLVVPAYLKLNWRKELEKWLLVKRPILIVDSETCERLPPSKVKPEKPSSGASKEAFEAYRKARIAHSLSAKLVMPKVAGPHVIITNYEVLHRFAEIPRFDMLGIDEGHYIKTMDTKRTQAVFGVKARRIMVATGTPALNRPVELYPLIKLLMKNPPTYQKFIREFCDAKSSGFGVDARGCSNPIKLQQLLRKNFMVRRLKRDVLKELPPKQRQVIELPATSEVKMIVDMEQAIWGLHEETLAELRLRRDEAEIAGDDESFQEIGKSMASTMRIAFTALAELRVKASKVKAPLIAAHLRDVMSGNNQKFIVFFYHKDAIGMLADEMERELGVRPLIITGDVSMSGRDLAVASFQEDPRHRLIIGTIGAMGTGVTLTASSTVLLAELDWRPGILAQAEDRAHRIGQRDSVLCQYFIFEKSVDSKMIGDVIAKMENLGRILDGEGHIDDEKRQKQVRVRQPRKWEPDVKAMTGDLMKVIHNALHFMVGQDKDMARERNAKGFSKFDAGIGHRLASRDCLTAREAAFAKHLLHKYRRQLPRELTLVLYGEDAL